MSVQGSLDARLALVARRSIEIIAEHQHASGAYVASPAFPVYRYCWLRDGAFIADSMSRVGQTESASRFFAWCAQVIEAQRSRIDALLVRHHAGETIAAEELLPTRYTLDGRVGSEEWWDFQLDGYGTWIWAAAEHLARTGADTAALHPAVELSARYLAAFWSRPCYDWWEEHPTEVHPSTLACVLAGLRAAVALGAIAPHAGDALDAAMASLERVLGGAAVVDGSLVKSLGRVDVDASLIAAATPLAVIDPRGTVAETTYRRIAAELGPDGVYRYLGDTFYGGGRWVVLAGFLGWHEARTGRRDAAASRLAWMAAQADDDGQLPEQVSEHALFPGRIAEWLQRWGRIAQPLLWSHAMYLSLANELGVTAQ